MSPPHPPGHNALTGIGLKVGSVCVFLAMSSLLKASEGIPTGELVFFRSFFAIFPIVLYLALQRQLLVGLKTRHPISHLWRGLVGSAGMGFGFFALTQLPLPEAIAISYATPLLIVVLSAVFLHEPVRLYRWSAAIVGFAGVLIIIWPNLTVFSGGISDLGGTALGTLSALVAAVFAAIAMMLVRRLVHTERSATIVIYFSVTSTIIGLLTIPLGWVMPTLEQFALLVMAGIAGGIGQILLTESYRHADMSVVAPFEYVSLILSVAIGYFIFREIPTVPMLAGGVIVVGAGLFIIYREHRLGLERRRASEVTPPQ